MQSSNVRKLLVCSLLIITMVPVVLSTLPSFQASAAKGCPNLCGPPSNPGGHQGNLQTTHGQQYNNGTTTTSADSSDSVTTST